MGVTVSCRRDVGLERLLAMGLALSCGRDVGIELLCAIREGDLQFVSELIKEKPKLVNSAIWQSGHHPLHYAAAHGQPQVLSALLEREAHLNALNSQKQTPLMLACKNGRLECVERLLARGADVLLFDSHHGRTCLHYAAKSGHVDCVQRILDFSQLPAVADSWGFTRFVNVRDSSGATPLHLAARCSHPAVVRLLLGSGALVCAMTTRPFANGSAFESSPLHFAACGGSTECVKELLAWGADRKQTDSEGHTPYFIAIKYKNPACAALLNPNTAEPLLWPSSWRFIIHLDPEAKKLLEAALAEANDAREKTVGFTHEKSVLTDEMGGTIEQEEDEGRELCYICFEQACTIEVENCGHQMCAGCTLALCCHSKPKPGMPNSPPPACPFCRCNILQLRPARPKEAFLPPTEADKEQDKNGASKSKKCVEGSSSSNSNSSSSSSSFIGLVGRGPLKLLPGRGSGRVADMDMLTESSSQDL